jgi:hypothetical protein
VFQGKLINPGRLYLFVFATLAWPVLAAGQAMPHDHSSMPGMQMPGMNDEDMNAAERFLMRLSSGTSVNPEGWPMPMLSPSLGSWHTMIMGQAFLVDTQQSGPRGGDKLYSNNWLMSSFEHRAGRNGAFQLQVMISLDPATITQRRYPLLFQTGESAFGRPIVDGQHPHDLFMGLTLQYARSFSENALWYVTFAPVGDPALGPVAYPHRASAMELSQAPISHHWQDSSHIANEVVTSGIAYKRLRVEASGFYGTEPDENRWNIDHGPINSWSGRLWYAPGKNWIAQVSVGRLTHPETLHPGDQLRTTASLEYTKPMPGGSWASSFVWGRNHSTATKGSTDAYLVESVLPIKKKGFITGRVESVDKNELFADDHELEEQLASQYASSFRVGAYTIGYTLNIPLFKHLQTAIGANVEWYTLPAPIKPYYGDHPVGGNIFLRFRLRAPR